MSLGVPTAEFTTIRLKVKTECCGKQFPWLADLSGVAPVTAGARLEVIHGAL
jgi:hypothetical protein